MLVKGLRILHSLLPPSFLYVRPTAAEYCVQLVVYVMWKHFEQGKTVAVASRAGNNVNTRISDIQKRQAQFVIGKLLKNKPVVSIFVT